MKRSGHTAEQRYERNLLVEGFSMQQQEILSQGRVAVVGAGGLGSACLNYLVAAGVGNITIIENDTISLSNLQRQILYATTDLGQSKAEVAAIRLSRLNPECRINIVTDRLTDENAVQFLSEQDIVVDCSDNYATRYVIDNFCGEHAVPMIYGTAEQIGGQVSVFHYGGAKGYGDLYPDMSQSAETPGVLSPIVGVIGSLQALEAIKILSGIGEPLVGRLLSVDGRTGTFSIFTLEG